MDKAYKILALRENISNRAAKELLDSKMVSLSGKLIRASDLVPSNANFKVQKVESPKIIFQNDEILAVDKPPFFDCENLLKIYKDWVLLNRLDKDTSGVILLTKQDSPFQAKAISEFKNERVYKEYLALCSGIVAESCEINKPIETIKGAFAFSKIAQKGGKHAITHITPLKIIGKKTLLKVVIKTGRTHQIRVHLNSINHPILGDKIYGKIPFKRLMLHSYKIKLFDYEFCVDKGDFWKYLQE